MILPENTEKLLELDTTMLWTCFKALMEEENEDNVKLKTLYTADTKLIETGINIKIPIWYITNEWYEIYPSSKKVKILGYGKFNLDEFMKEKDGRELLMRKIIAEYMEEGPTTEPRSQTI